MIVALGTDHGGFGLKTPIVDAIRGAGHEVLDCGAFVMQSDDDYPDFAARVAQAVSGGGAARGVLICGSGVGASIAANKFVGIRSALCHDTFSAHQGVEDDSMNVIALGARVVGPSLASEIVTTFLHAEFSGAERHKRRLEKVNAFDSSRG
jgi:ribose 5-phosphate isomerase B